jgi:3-dehydroquinate synthase/2-deoxy-scyllo-inosose synthase
MVFDNALLKEDVDLLSEYINGYAAIHTLGIQVSEETKNVVSLNEIMELLIENGITRSTYVIAMGGGILGNIVGMVSGLMYRGIDFIHIPTTMIACADSVLSIKQAVNSKNAKNIIGLYYAPVAVLTCYRLFRTLPAEQVAAGYVEYIKNMMILLPENIDSFLRSEFHLSSLTFNQILEFISDSIGAKNRLLANDPHERNEAIIFEYGHTLGHAVELISKGQINHGEGVAIGMLTASLISNKLGYFQKRHVDTLLRLLNKIEIVPLIKRKFVHIDKIASRELLQILLFDNKRGYIATRSNEIPMVILKDFTVPISTGAICLIPVRQDLVLRCYKEAVKILLGGD